MAVSKTFCTPSLDFAEHSQYATAPVCVRTCVFSILCCLVHKLAGIPRPSTHKYYWPEQKIIIKSPCIGKMGKLINSYQWSAPLPRHLLVWCTRCCVFSSFWLPWSWNLDCASHFWCRITRLGYSDSVCEAPAPIYLWHSPRMFARWLKNIVGRHLIRVSVCWWVLLRHAHANDFGMCSCGR